MAKFTIIKRDHVDQLLMLYAMRIDNSYIVIDSNNGFSTIAQYSEKYKQVKLITVPTDQLNTSLELRSADT